jgi:hypothetical protein
MNPGACGSPSRDLVKGVLHDDMPDERGEDLELFNTAHAQARGRLDKEHACCDASRSITARLLMRKYAPPLTAYTHNGDFCSKYKHMSCNPRRPFT